MCLKSLRFWQPLLQVYLQRQWAQDLIYLGVALSLRLPQWVRLFCGRSDIKSKKPFFSEERRGGWAAGRQAVQSCEIPRAGYKESILKRMDFFYVIG